MASVAADQEGNLPLTESARETLVVMRVTGKYSMRPDADLVANCVDLLEHDQRSNVLAEGVGRVMDGQDYCAFEFFLLHACQRRG
jgi:hypothetical protein